MKEFTDQHEFDITNIKMRTDGHDCDIQQLTSELSFLRDNVEKITSEFEMYKVQSQPINELFLSTLCSFTFRTAVDNVKNDIYMYDTTRGVRSSIEYVINNIINAHNNSLSMPMNMFNIVDWSLLIIDESNEEYNIIDFLNVIFNKNYNGFCVSRETEYRQLSGIIQKHLSIEEISHLIHEGNQVIGDYIISRIDDKCFESIVNYTFNECSPESVKRLWSKMPDNDAYRDLYGERLYTVICDKNNHHYERVTSDFMFIKRVREKINRVDNYYKLLNRY